MQCTNCGAIAPDGASFCGNCGQALAGPSPTEAGDLGATVFCLNCGAQATANDTVCLQCGRVMQAPGQGDTYDEQPGFSPQASPAQVAFPPRRLGELIGESARVYLRNPLVYLGIGLVPQLPGLAGLGPLPLWWAIILAILSFVLTALAFGAIIHAVAADYLGLPSSVVASFDRARQRGLFLVVSSFAFLVLLFSSFLLILVLVGFLLLPFLLVLFWFYPQAIMLENLSPVDAFRRSVALVQNNWWRAFVTGVAYSVPMIVFLAVVFSSSSDPLASKLVSIVSVLVSTIATPWIMIGSTLLYFDLRARKGGFSMEVLRSELGANHPDQ